MKMFSKVIKVLYSTLMTIIIILGLALLVLFAFGVHPYVVESGSMVPKLQVGSVCFVNTKVPYSEIKEGDVIAFKATTGMRVTHRVVSITSEGFTTKGDANKNEDGQIVKEGNYLGRTEFSVPKLGYWVKNIQTPLGMVFAGVIILIFVLLGMLFDDSDKKKKSGRRYVQRREKQPSITNTVTEGNEISNSMIIKRIQSVK